MTERTDTLERVGGRVAAELGDGPGDGRLAAQKRALIAEMGSGSTTRRRWGLVAAAAAVAVIASLSALVLLPDEDTLAFSVGDEAGHAEPGRWIRNPQTEALPLRFADGSVIELGERATARVVRSDRDAVRVDLSEGDVIAKIDPDDEISWTIEAGPYRVSVLGTIFSMDWNPKTSGLVVAVTRGLVLVEGRNLEPRGVELTDGERLEIQGEAGRYAVGPIDKGKERTLPLATSTVEPLTDEPEASPSPRPATHATGPDQHHRPAATQTTEPAGGPPEYEEETVEPTGPDWTELCDRGEYQVAVESAIAAGLDGIVATGTRQQLRQLGDAARYARRAALAVRVLEALRERFPGSADARTAAFLLGRVSQELRGDPASAARWFRTYLNETPNGPLAEEALGRLVDASDKAGARNASRRSAREYLERYPKGVFAPLARSVLGE
jgi:hypothetical protein